MKLMLALALMSLPLPVFAQAQTSTDIPGKTSAGVQFIQPRDWAAQANGAVTMFVSPEADLRLAVVDVGERRRAGGGGQGVVALQARRRPMVRLVTARRPPMAGTSA